MKRIGILGGTFNPVHNAHLAMAQAAMEQYNLSKVLFMPSKNPPHKEKEEIVSEEHRRRMIGFAIQDYPQFHFSDFELRREGITYTSDTLRLLKEEHPEWEIYFILGGDSLNSFLKWHEPENILKYAVVLAAPRAGVKFSEIEKLCKKISHKLSGNVLPFRMKQLKISSRQIRKKTKKGRAWRESVRKMYAAIFVSTVYMVRRRFLVPQGSWRTVTGRAYMKLSRPHFQRKGISIRLGSRIQRCS